MSNRIQCKSCTRWVDFRHLNRHKSSKVCWSKTKVLEAINPVFDEMREKNFVTVGHGGFSKTLKNENIETIRAPTGAMWNDLVDEVELHYGTWAPEWAVLIASSGGTLKKRRALLRICADDPQKRKAIHAVLLMAKNTGERLFAIRQFYDLWM